jgi:hypothetical protein
MAPYFFLFVDILIKMFTRENDGHSRPEKLNKRKAAYRLKLEYESLKI